MLLLLPVTGWNSSVDFHSAVLIDCVRFQWMHVFHPIVPASPQSGFATVIENDLDFQACSGY